MVHCTRLSVDFFIQFSGEHVFFSQCVSVSFGIIKGRGPQGCMYIRNISFGTTYCKL